MLVHLTKHFCYQSEIFRKKNHKDLVLGGGLLDGKFAAAARGSKLLKKDGS